MYRVNGCSLTLAMRNVLIDHVDGSCPVSTRDLHRIVVVQALIGRGLLRGTFRGPAVSRPRETFITDKGRAALAMVLADCADALVRAGRGGMLIPRSSLDPQEMRKTLTAVERVE